MANLYVFHHGFGMNGELWYSVFDLDSSTWSPDRQVPNVGISGSPSAVVYPGRGIYVFHQGVANYSGPFDKAGSGGARPDGGRALVEDGQLWYSFFDGTNWQPDTLVPNVGISEEPSAVVFPGGGMSVFHRGDDVRGTLWYSFFDGTNWQPDTLVPNVRLTYSPSAVVFPGGGVSVFHEGNADDEQLWYSFFDGTNSTWQPDTQVPNVGMSFGPSAVVFPDGSVSVFHQGSNNSGQLWYSFFDGTNSTWQPDTFVPNVGLSTWPGAVLLPDGRSISVFHDGSEDSGQLWYSFFDGTNSTWQPDTLVPNVGISYGPSAVIF